ncbi:hypothetical protein BDN72DRAFT_935050 [Pluteus cervinus]|uniref:Uncharacterized protein n=1 Tax=Pluteus cervinus TaxID=181527 RepID=A0ACD3A7E8_9AGAR|nr:hypothetical protein BDN72DRAFT_935050 [Pluteus cervinus]
MSSDHGHGRSEVQHRQPDLLEIEPHGVEVISLPNLEREVGVTNSSAEHPVVARLLSVIINDFRSGTGRVQTTQLLVDGTDISDLVVIGALNSPEPPEILAESSAQLEAGRPIDGYININYWQDEYSMSLVRGPGNFFATVRGRTENLVVPNETDSSAPQTVAEPVQDEGTRWSLLRIWKRWTQDASRILRAITPHWIWCLATAEQQLDWSVVFCYSVMAIAMIVEIIKLYHCFYPTYTPPAGCIMILNQPQ